MDYYNYHLLNVSRSFHFCIKELAQPLKHWVGISYLLCRLADTIEDYAWESPQLQEQAFQIFLSFTDKIPDPQGLVKWSSSFPHHINPVERALIDESAVLFTDFHNLPIDISCSIKKCINTMVDGMQLFQNKKIKTSILKLDSQEETNQYCYYVAGVVGELLETLFCKSIGIDLVCDKKILMSYHFGLFLQKTNMLKDQKGDEQQGCYFIASQDEFMQSMCIDARQAMDYLKEIPIKEGKGYRIFCAWSLFIGMASFPWIYNNKNATKISHIPRKTTLALIAHVKMRINDNHALELLFQSYAKAMDVCRLRAS